MKKLLGHFSGLSWVRIVLYIVGALLAYFLISSAWDGIKHAIFGNPEVVQAKGETIVAEEQGKAEANIADQTITTIRERDVYREHVTNVVREGQERVNAVDQGQQLDPDIDAAVAAGLCSVHHSLCRGTGAEEVQPVHEPVPGED